MNSLVSKDEPLRDSMVHVGYLILKCLERAKDGRLALTELAAQLRKHKVDKSRPMTFGLVFLHLAGLVEFKAPYVYRVNP
jgi:hypothetical protein